MQTGTEEASEPNTTSKVEETFGEVTFMVDPDQEEVVVEWAANGQEGEVVQPYLAEAVPQAEQDEQRSTIGSNFFDQEGEWRSTVIGQTVGGKNVQVQKNPKGLGYLINFQSGGELPVELQGVFTKYEFAELQARLWLNKNHAQARSETAKS